jgi:hypothetical protein
MPGIFDKMKSGAERASFEADRLWRVNQARSTLRGLEGGLEAQLAALGLQTLALYDAGGLTQAELLASCGPIDALRQQIEGQKAEVERIQQEKLPTEPGAEQERPPEAPVHEEPARAAAESTQERICARCHSPVMAGARFCQECGAPAP